MIRFSHLFLLFCGLVLLYSLGNWSLPLIDRDEPRFAEASREMRQSGDFIIPRLNGNYRFDKPPLIYWCQAAAFACLGENDFAARFPSALFAAAAAIVTAAWGARLYGSKVGFWAGLAFGTCLQVFIHARAGVADMPMVFFFLTASWTGWERSCNRDSGNPSSRALESQARRGNRGSGPESKALWWCFYSSLALGFLAKGPVALLPIFSAPLSAWINGTRYRLHVASALAGLLLTAFIVGLWGIPALWMTHGEFFNVGIGRHVLMRSIEPMESHGGIGVFGYFGLLPFYLISIFFSFFPWCIFLPGTIRHLRGERGAPENYLLCTIAPVILVFTAVQTKLPHYILPCFPMLSILAARQIAQSRWSPRIAGSVIAIYAVVALLVFPAIAPYFPARAIVDAVQPDLNAETRTASLGYDEQSLIWYLRGTTRAFHVRLEAVDFSHFMTAAGPALCVVSKEHLDSLTIDPVWHSFQRQGYNFARWKWRRTKVLGFIASLPLPQTVDLVAFVKG